MTLEELEERVTKKVSRFGVKLPLRFQNPASSDATPVVLRDLQDLRDAYEAALKAGTSTSAVITPLQRITVYASTASEMATSTSRTAEDSSAATAPTTRPMPDAPAEQRASPQASGDASSASSHITQRLMENILTAVRNHDFTSHSSDGRVARCVSAGPATPSSKQITPRLSIKRTSAFISPQQQTGEAASPQQCRRHLSSDDAQPALCSSLA